MNLRVMSWWRAGTPDLKSGCHDVSDFCLLAMISVRHNRLCSHPDSGGHWFSHVRSLSASGSAHLAHPCLSLCPELAKELLRMAPFHRFRIDHSRRASLPACSTFLG